jgi:hypothetical protein
MIAEESVGAGWVRPRRGITLGRDVAIKMICGAMASRRLRAVPPGESAGARPSAHRSGLEVGEVEDQPYFNMKQSKNDARPPPLESLDTRAAVAMLIARRRGIAAYSTAISSRQHSA